MADEEERSSTWNRSNVARHYRWPTGCLLGGAASTLVVLGIGFARYDGEWPFGSHGPGFSLIPACIALILLLIGLTSWLPRRDRTFVPALVIALGIGVLVAGFCATQ